MRRPWWSAVGLMLAVWPIAAMPFSSPDVFLERLLVEGPAADTLFVHSIEGDDRSATYDVALACLWLLERGRRDEAGRLLRGLATRQRPDGALPFSWGSRDGATTPGYVRAGAIAWAGYAAVRWLQGTPDGPAREAIAGFAERSANYLLGTRVAKPGDPRDGLVLGGEGHYAYAETNGDLTETWVPDALSWASSEHNIDTWFFLQALARATGQERYREAADGLGRALVTSLWDDQAGRFSQGVDLPYASFPRWDTTPALDCASWGALFLLARGDRLRARRAYAATTRFTARDATTGATGFRPYLRRPLIESRAALEHHRARLPAADWNECNAVWPEGTAGVALVACRLGETARAREILAGLEPLRQPSGGLVGLSLDIPLEFTNRPVLAGTAWHALVAAEIAGQPGTGRLWANH